MEDAQFQQLRRAELGAIDEKESRLRHIVAREDVQGLLLRQEAVRGTKMSDACLERISLALKVIGGMEVRGRNTCRM